LNLKDVINEEISERKLNEEKYKIRNHKMLNPQAKTVKNIS